MSCHKEFLAFMKFLSTALLTLSSLAMAESSGAIAIRNARIVTVSGPVITKGTVVLRNGLIEAVGETVTAPADAWIVDGEGLTVYPGLIDGLSTFGIESPAPAVGGALAAALTPGGRGAAAAATPPAAYSRGPEDRPLTTSWLKAADLVKTTDRKLELARNAGFTSAVTFPKTGIFAGQGAVVNLAAARNADMVVVPSAGQYITMATNGFGGGGFPSALFGTISYIRQIYLDAARYQRVRDQYAASPVGLPRPEYDRALEGVIESPRILLPASREIEIRRMIRFAAELKQKTILYGMHEGYKTAELIKQSGLPVLVSLKWPEKARDSDPDEVEPLRQLELRDKAPTSPAVLAKQGVMFAFYSDTVEQPRDLLRAVRKAMDQGLAQSDALKALTLNVAQIYGVGDRMGSIEKGKIANLVVTSGELLQERPQVKMIFVDGVKYDPVPEAPTPGAGRMGGAPTTPTPGPGLRSEGSNQ
jgi:nucleotide-binding universal stress UspA family protein